LKPDRFLPATGYQEKERWAKAGIGEIELVKGETDLAIRTAVKKGLESIELKSVRLTRIEAKPKIAERTEADE
jgi:hypothetical protein